MQQCLPLNETLKLTLVDLPFEAQSLLRMKLYEKPPVFKLFRTVVIKNYK